VNWREVGRAAATAAPTFASADSSRRTIAEPPKPPPVMRAPRAPSDSAVETTRSSSDAGDPEVVAQRGVAGGENGTDVYRAARVEEGDHLFDAAVLGDDVPGQPAQRSSGRAARAASNSS